MTISPIAAADTFTADQGMTSTTVTSNLGADNGAGLDQVPDGTILGWVAGTGFTPVGDGDRYLGAFFSDGVLSYLSNTGTVSYPFPIITTATAVTSTEGGWIVLDPSGNATYQSALGFSGQDSFTYTLVDAEFNATTATVTFNVAASEGANDRPIAADDAFTLNEDTVLSGNLLADNGGGPDTEPDGAMRCM
jgi:Bacterial Ig domain/Bacterial cadherin-like domain